MTTWSKLLNTFGHLYIDLFIWISLQVSCNDIHLIDFIIKMGSKGKEDTKSCELGNKWKGFYEIFSRYLQEALCNHWSNLRHLRVLPYT